MSDKNEHDLRLVARYVDGELAGDALEAFERRLEQESALRLEVEALRSQSQLFGQGPIAVPQPAFRGRVLEAVAEAGRRQLTEQAPEAELLHRWAPRVVGVAALVLVFCGAFAAGLFDRGESGDLSASPPDELQSRMEALDERILEEGIVDPFADPEAEPEEGEAIRDR